MPDNEPPWDDRVQFRTSSDGATFAYRPNEVIVSRRALDDLAGRLGTRKLVTEEIVCGAEPSGSDLILVRGVPDPIAAAAELRARGFAARPNHVLFALLFMAVSMVATYVPILGPMFISALHLRAHRTMFGDEREPKLLLG